MQHQTIWTSSNDHTFSVVGEWPEPVDVTARPIVTNYWFGVTVGFFYRGSNSFGHWYSSNVTDAITAWRVAQILPRVKMLRERSSGYNSTLCGLVIAMGGDRHEKRFYERARDLGMTVEELEDEIFQLSELWPDVRTLREMWDRLPDNEQEKIVGPIRKAITLGEIPFDTDLVGRLELCELRLRTVEEQKHHEDALIKAGLAPGQSLRQFMLDIGITNLLYTIHDDFAPTHFEMDELDREIMSCLIGKMGFYSSISLVTSMKQPNDPTAHHTAGGGGVTIFMHDFGKSGSPRLPLLGETKELVSVRWDRVTEHFLLTVRPAGYEHDDRDLQMSVSELRKQIGEDMKMPHPLVPGQSAPWCVIENGAKPGVLRRMFGLV